MRLYSNGKLLISGEYVILDGALSLAVPTLFGQYLEILKVDSKYIKWTSKNSNGKVWFQCKIYRKNLELDKIDAGAKIHDIQETLAILDNTVNNLIKKKIYFLSEHFTSLEARVLDLDRHFDQASLDRKEDSRRITNEINTLRGNIREDINDVKDIIMKLMNALKTDDD